MFFLGPVFFDEKTDINCSCLIAKPLFSVAFRFWFSVYCSAKTNRSQSCRSDVSDHLHRAPNCAITGSSSFPLTVVVVVVTPPLPRDGGTTRTAIQVNAVNLIELG